MSFGRQRRVSFVDQAASAACVCGLRTTEDWGTEGRQRRKTEKRGRLRGLPVPAK